jgi:hypothetical protein
MTDALPRAVRTLDFDYHSRRTLNAALDSKTPPTIATAQPK